jgi:hypothetical protein
MADDEAEESRPLGIGSETPVSKGRRALAKVDRELSTEEFATAAVQKLLMDENDRLLSEIEVLSGIRDRYHEADKKASKLEERLTRDQRLDILFAVSLAVGAALLGLAPLGWKVQPLGLLLLTFGAALVLGAAIARFRK